MSQYKTIPKYGVIIENETVAITAENIKCGGCANTITNALKEFNLENIQIIPESNIITFHNPSSDNVVLSALNKLRSLGYPVAETEDGITALALKAKSFASCAIGKMKN